MRFILLRVLPQFLKFGVEKPDSIHKLIEYPVVSQQKPNLRQIWLLGHQRMMTKLQKKPEKNGIGVKVEFKVGDAVLVNQHSLSSAENAIFFLFFEGPFMF